jgi:hypothetical protein
VWATRKVAQVRALADRGPHGIIGLRIGHVYDRATGIDGFARQLHTVEHEVWSHPEEEAVLHRQGLPLIPVGNDHPRSRTLGHGAPLRRGGEACASPSAQVGGLQCGEQWSAA